MTTPMAETNRRSWRPRRRFDDDFKPQAVRLVLDEGKGVTAVARDLDLTETALRTWVRTDKSRLGGTTEATRVVRVIRFRNTEEDRS